MRRQRDAAIAAKMKEEGKTEDGETAGWGRENPAAKADAKPAGGEGGFITRSNKPREETKAETGRPTFTRGNTRKDDAPDTGFARGNFKSKKEDTSKADDKPMRRGPPRDGPKPGGDGGFGGFRNANKAARK